MKILLVYPKSPPTFWSFKYSLPFIGKKVAFPPLGLLTVAAILPKEWDKKLIDLNIQKLKDEDIEWADFVFISAMVIHKESANEIVKIAKKFNKKIVAGGPLFTTGHEEFLKDIDYFVLGEGEVTIPLFLSDLEKGSLKKIYKPDKWPDVSKTPIPLWHLADLKKYAFMNIQYSRGCPFNCEFCDIVLLNGRVPRTKDKDQILKELDSLYNCGWRRGIFFVDDNFIGNKVKLKGEILPAIIKWMEEKNYPFFFNTQVSINISDDKELMESMVKAGFKTVFVGIESPDEGSLKECGKFQNTNRSLLDSVKAMHNSGLQVQAGFIIGFDNDAPTIFNKMIEFIQKSRILTAMVGLLQAAPKTRLWERLKKEGRLTSESTGNNTDCTTNFATKMDRQILTSGYKRVLSQIYSPKNYYQRLTDFLKEYKPGSRRKSRINWEGFLAFLRSILVLGIIEKERMYYWKLILWCFFKKIKIFPLAVEGAIYGFHLRKISEKYLKNSLG